MTKKCHRKHLALETELRQLNQRLAGTICSNAAAARTEAAALVEREVAPLKASLAAVASMAQASAAKFEAESKQCAVLTEEAAQLRAARDEALRQAIESSTDARSVADAARVLLDRWEATQDTIVQLQTTVTMLQQELNGDSPLVEDGDTCRYCRQLNMPCSSNRTLDGKDHLRCSDYDRDANDAPQRLPSTNSAAIARIRATTTLASGIHGRTQGGDSATTNISLVAPPLSEQRSRQAVVSARVRAHSSGSRRIVAAQLSRGEHMSPGQVVTARPAPLQQVSDSTSSHTDTKRSAPTLSERPGDSARNAVQPRSYRSRPPTTAFPRVHDDHHSSSVVDLRGGGRPLPTLPLMSSRNA